MGQPLIRENIQICNYEEKRTHRVSLSDIVVVIAVDWSRHYCLLELGVVNAWQGGYIGS